MRHCIPADSAALAYYVRGAKLLVAGQSGWGHRYPLPDRARLESRRPSLSTCSADHRPPLPAPSDWTRYETICLILLGRLGGVPCHSSHSDSRWPASSPSRPCRCPRKHATRAGTRTGSGAIRRLPSRGPEPKTLSAFKWSVLALSNPVFSRLDGRFARNLARQQLSGPLPRPDGVALS